jgi:hypothetical protein
MCFTVGGGIESYVLYCKERVGIFVLQSRNDLEAMCCM